MPDFIYLASQSPRRRQLLEQLGVRHELLLPNVQGDVVEDAEGIEAVLPGESPDDYVMRVTGLKLDAAVARCARRGLPSAPILCSDTTVALGPTIYGKPDDAAHAARMLAELSGQTHRVLTAVAVQAGQGGQGAVAQRLQALSVSEVTFASLTPAQITAYVATGEPLGKAGAYGIQGAAAAFIPVLHGSYSGIMGLPMFETAQLLRSIGFAV
ncbi:septum formation protein [Acidovorax sp. 62]|uniref:Maf family protein n=1 Tax=Acidovorax sp. 62 TaxID=2035203 RepID=UPI000C18433B|nr:Maf family protein [Acidovorax sp. 62]PIF90784.1 septum formation protein [Acidovorax sp. 62]